MTSNSRLRTLGSREAGPGRPVYVTGEIGINHNGDLENAFALIDAAPTPAVTPSSSRSGPRRSAPRATSGTSSATPPGAG